MADKMRIKQEKIGGVIMDYTYYAGQDLYSDGAVEDEMLDIAMNNSPEHFLQIAGRFFIIFHRCAQILLTGYLSKKQTKCLRLVLDVGQLPVH